MTEKQNQLGICDFCGGSILHREWYTTHGAPRLYCSLECRQTANSRNGNAKRLAKLMKRIRTGKWKNPMAGLDRETIRAKNSAAARKGRLREVSEGRWRNPALSAAAKCKLSRPRKHTGALHRAIEKLRVTTMNELSRSERTTYLAYRQKLRDARRAELNRAARERYRMHQNAMTKAQRERQRAKWRDQNTKRTRKRRTKP